MQDQDELNTTSGNEPVTPASSTNAPFTPPDQTTDMPPVTSPTEQTSSTPETAETQPVQQWSQPPVTEPVTQQTPAQQVPQPVEPEQNWFSKLFNIFKK